MTLYRVQRSGSRPGTVTIGGLKLPPPGALVGRFDLSLFPVGYFAEAPETAIYESLARREATALSLFLLARRQLLAVQSRRGNRLADLRPHVSSWPVLQSLRLHVTQQLAADAQRLGFEGIVYRSAQQYAHDCYALFGSALRALQMFSRVALVQLCSRPADSIAPWPQQSLGHKCRWCLDSKLSVAAAQRFFFSSRWAFTAHLNPCEPKRHRQLSCAGR
jgi:hypothetical protein